MQKEKDKETEKTKEVSTSSGYGNPFSVFDKIYKYVNRTESKEDKEERERKEVEADRRLLFSATKPAQLLSQGGGDLVSKYRRPLPDDQMQKVSMNLNVKPARPDKEPLTDLERKAALKKENFPSPGKF